MKDFVKNLCGSESYYPAINTIISWYYIRKVREIIQKNTTEFSVFHFASTRLIQEKNGISYFRIEKITNKETYFINFDGKIREKHESKTKTKIPDKIAEKIIEELRNDKEENLYLNLLKQTEARWRENQQTVEKNTKLLEASPFSCSIFDGRYSESRFFTNERNKRFFMLRDKTTNKCALINAKGEMISDFIYDDIFGFIDEEENFIFVVKDSKSGLIDCLGNVVAETVYDNIDSFSDGLAMVRQNGKTGYINSTGQIAIPLIYDKGESFFFGSAKVTLNDKTFYINRNGERIEV